MGNRWGKDEPCGHSWTQSPVPQTLACLWQLVAYLIAMSRECAALFISLRSSDCMLWLLSGASAQLWDSACQLARTLPCVPPPLEPSRGASGWDAAVSPVITNKPHLSRPMMIKAAQSRLLFGEVSRTHIMACIENNLKRKLSAFTLI